MGCSGCEWWQALPSPPVPWQGCDGRAAKAVPNLHCMPANLQLFPLLCLCLGKRKDSTLNPKVQTWKQIKSLFELHQTWAVQNSAQTVGRDLVKCSCQRHFVFAWDKSHWNILKHYKWPALHSPLQDCSSSCVRAESVFWKVQLLCVTAQPRLKETYGEISNEIKSNKFGPKSAISFLADIDVKE